MRRRTERRVRTGRAVFVAAFTGACVATASIAVVDPAGAETLAPASGVRADAGKSSPGATYTVQAGDTLTGVAARTGSSVGAIAAANGLTPPYVLQPGQRLRVGKASTPPKGATPATSALKAGSTYTVAAGDTLSGIAARAGVPAAAIAAENGIASPDSLRIGRALRIPAAGSGAARSQGAAGKIGTGSYEVAAGDTLERIARRSGVSVAALAAANGIRGPQYVIVVGQDLTIPRGGAGTPAGSTRTVKPGPYVVKAGDTVLGLARRSGIPARAIIAANGLAPPAYMIRSGSTIRIPSGGGGQGTAAPASPGAPVAGGSYRVRRGDTVLDIARRSGSPASAIVAANSLAPPRFLIRENQVLDLPKPGSTSAKSPGSTATSSGSGTWRVKAGDTVSSIAQRTGTSAAAIIAANGLAPPSFLIREGGTLVIPERGTAAASPSVPRSPGSPTPPGAGRHPTKGEVEAALERYANRYGLPRDLVKGLAWIESGWKQEAVSSAGAVGVMQLMPGTAEWIGQAIVRRNLDRFDYEQNVEGGSAYLRWLLNQVGNDERLALASYYQGLGAVRRKGGPSAEGDTYAKAVQSARRRY